MSYQFSIGCRLIKPGDYAKKYPKYEEDMDIQIEMPINYAAAVVTGGAAGCSYLNYVEIILDYYTEIIFDYTKRKFAKAFMYFDAYHYCLLLENNIIEYEPDGIKKRLKVGKISDFIWNFNGTTNTSFKELEQILKDPGEDWSGEVYKPKKHNCQHFVNFCLEKIGVKERIITKYTYQEQRKKHNEEKEKEMKEEKESEKEKEKTTKKNKNADCLIF